MAVLMLAITAGFYWKITLTKQYSWFGAGEGDISLQVLPWYQFEAREFHSWRMPLWDPHLWMGQPLLAQAQPGAAYPLNWLLFALPLHNGLIRIDALNWYFIAIHFMAMAFCYMLCRDLGRSPAASLIAGCVFSLAGYIGTTDWPQMVNGAVWAPLVLLFLLRAVRERAPWFSAALSGGFLGVAWLSGHHQIPLFATLTIGCVWLFFILQGGKVNWRVVGQAGIAFAAMFLVSAMLTLPTYEYGKLALRWSGPPDPLAWDQKVPYSVHADYSMPASSLLAIFIPGLNRHADPFVGTIAFALALAGYALAWRHRVVRICTAIAVGGLLLSLGFHNIFHGVLYALVPLFDKARVPSTAIYLFHLGLVVLVAFGADEFFTPGEDAKWKIRIAAASAVFGFALWFLFFQAVLAAKLNFDVEDRTVLTALFAILSGGILYAVVKGRLARNHGIAALLILMLIELGNDSGYAIRENKNGHRLVEQYEVNADIVDYLKRQPGPFRVDIDSDALSANIGDWYGVDVREGFVAGALANVFHMEWGSDRAKNLFGVAYYIGKKPSGAAQDLVFEGSSGLKVYHNPQAFPRVWTVHESAVVSNARDANRVVGDPNVDLRRTVAITQQIPPMGGCDPAQDQLRVTRLDPRALTVQADLACDGMIVVSENYFPGWRAAIDGQPAEVRQVDGALQAVAVPRGKHEVQLQYRPWSFILGSILSLIGVAGIALLGWRSRNSR